MAYRWSGGGGVPTRERRNDSMNSTALNRGITFSRSGFENPFGADPACGADDDVLGFFNLACLHVTDTRRAVHIAW